MLTNRDICAPNLSVAWIKALDAVRRMPKHAATHLVVRIEDPSLEVPAIRRLADDLVSRGGIQRITSVRSTIFPASWAERFPDPPSLADHFRGQYETLRRFPKNRAGTYFGRMVAYPRGDGEFIDQLSDVVEALRKESRHRHMSSRYEVNIWVPGDLPSGMGFPCMSHLSFHLDEGNLYLHATYRNQYLVERACGNYLGLAELQQYVAKASGLNPGELMVVAGHAKVDTPGAVNLTAVKETVERAASHI
jgi:Thymidylate synthase